MPISITWPANGGAGWGLDGMMSLSRRGRGWADQLSSAAGGGMVPPPAPPPAKVAAG